MKHVILFTVLTFCCILTKAQDVIVKNDEKKNEEKNETSAPVEANDSKNIVPPNGKGVIYVVRPAVMGFAIGIPVSCDGNWVGTTRGKNFIYTVVDPGKHIISGKAENLSEVEVNVEAGKTYYVLQNIKMGMVMARNKLELTDEQTGKTKLEKCKLAEEKK